MSRIAPSQSKQAFERLVRETGVAFLLLQPRASTGKTAMDIEDEKTPLEKMGIIIPEEFVGLFADPPLLEGEDPDHIHSFDGG